MKKLLLFLIFCFAFASISIAGQDSMLIDRNGIAKRTKMLLNAGADTGTSYEISSAEITIYESYCVVDTEGNTATDTLSTINIGASVGKYDGVQDGDFLVIRQELASQDVTIDETGNIELVKFSSITLSDPTKDFAMFFYDSALAKWVLFMFADDGGIVGVAIDDCIIGANTAAAGTFTDLTATGNLTMSGSGNTTLTGTLTMGVATGNATITTGNTNLTVTVGGITYYLKAHTSQ